MKTKWFISTSLMFVLFATVVKGFTIDGTASTGEYPAGQPLAVQALGTGAGDNTDAVINVSSGSELDAAYGVISNGTLYLVIAGNMQSDLSGDFNKLSIFIHTGASGQNTLANNGPVGSGADFGAIPRMSAGGDDANCLGCPGLTFDAGFNAAYWIGISYGGGTNPTMYVNYAELPLAGGGASYYVGGAQPTNSALTGGDQNPFGIQGTINNSNIGGVDTNLCNVNTNGAAQTIAAATVQTGVELAISLNALGGPSIVSPVKVTAFLTTNNYSQIYDQILSPGTIGGCVDTLAYGDPLTNNFSTLAGTHNFTIPIVGCNYTISPFSAFYDSPGGAGSFTVGVLGGGGCSYTATSSVPWIVVTSGGSGSGTGNFTVNYTVSANPGAPVRTGTITVTGAGPTGIDTFTVTQGGVALSKDFVVDGTLDPAYGCVVAIQEIQTQFGNATNGNAVVANNGSELDTAYGVIENGVLFLLFGGNLESNINKNQLNIFFMTRPGGLNTLTNRQVTVIRNNMLNNMGSNTNFFNAGGTNINTLVGPGLTFDAGFAPNYWIGVNASGGTPSTFSFFVDYAELWPGSTNGSAIATNGYFVGYNHGTNGVMLLDSGGKNPFAMQGTINNSNTNGVDGGTCNSNAALVVESTLAATVTNGVELGIPLAALGSPTGTIAICAFISSPDGTYMANQLLSPLSSNGAAYCQGNLGGVTNTPNINLGNFPGAHTFVVGPEMRITSIATAGTNLVINYLPEANTNWTYQLQRTSSLSNNVNNAIWLSVGALRNGTNGIISQTVFPSQGSTNKPAQFYRVRQTPQCQ